MSKIIGTLGGLTLGLFAGATYHNEILGTKSNPVPLTPNYSSVREAISQNLVKPDYDYGTISPALVRLAWHASGTYDQKSQTGGSNGSTMRYEKEASDGANAGLKLVQSFLQPVKEQFPNVSTADLWILASYVAIEEMGGPNIPFTPGRTDAKSENECPPNGRLPDASKDAKHVREVFGRMGFTDREMVCLIGGGHSIGKCHKDRSGYEGPWTFAPISFTNLYFKELLDNTWKPKKWDGPLQYEDKSGKLMMLPTDMEFKNDPKFRKWCELYKNDNEQFQSDFKDVFKKLTELGFQTSY